MNFNETIESIMNGESSLSYSSLKAFLKSPKHFKQYKTDKITTEAMEQGKRFHMAILEPGQFKSKYWILDDTEKCEEIGGTKPRGTKAYKEWVYEQSLLHEGKDLIKADEYETYLKMGDYLRKNSATKELMNGLIYKEKAFEFEHEGFKITGKIDGEGDNYTIDLKKVSNAEFKKIRWSVKDDDYHMQGALYLAASKKLYHYLIFIDMDCNVNVIKLSKETIEEGFGRFETALSRFHDCTEQDLWDSSYEFYNNGYTEI